MKLYENTNGLEVLIETVLEAGIVLEEFDKLNNEGEYTEYIKLLGDSYQNDCLPIRLVGKKALEAVYAFPSLDSSSTFA